MFFWRELYPGIEKLDDPKKAIKIIESIQKSFEKMIDGVSKSRNKYVDDMKDIVKATETLDKSLKNIKPSTEEGAKELAEMSKTADVAAKQYETLKKKVVALEGTMGQLTEEQDEYNKSVEKTIKNNKELEKLQKKLTSLNSEDAKEIAKVRVQIQERNKELREQAKETLGVVKTQSLFSKNQDRIAEALENVGGSSANAVGGIKAFGKSLLALLANPIVLIIAGIAAVLGVLGKAFLKTEKAAKFFAKAGAFIDGAFSAVVKVADNLAESIQSLFDDPVESLKSFGNLLLNNIINRFKAIPAIVSIAGKAFQQLINRDIEGLKESAKEAGQALIQLQTGVDKQQQDKIAQGFSNLTKEVLENANAFMNLEDARRAVRIENRKLEKSAEKLLTQEEELKAIRDDATRSFAEREAASEAARQALEERTKDELKIAQNNLNLLNAEVKIRKQNGEEIQDLLDSQLDAYKAFVASEREYTLAVKENEKERNQLRQDRLERDLDILIDGFDNQKSINERIIADDRRVLGERKQVFEETRKLSEKSFSSQIATIQLFTDEYVNANDLLATSDAVVLSQKIRQLGLSEIIEGRLLEVIRERRTVTQDLADIERDLADAELEIAQRKDAVSQFELDRLAQRKAIAVETKDFSIWAVNDRVKAEIEAEKFRTETLLKDETLLASEREAIMKKSEDTITHIREQGSRDRTSIIEAEISRVFELGEAVIGFFSALNERRNLEDQARIEKIEEQRERELQGAENNEQLQNAINEKADRKKAEIERRQAIRARKLAVAEKAATIAGIVLNTALAVSKVLGQAGIFGIPLVPVVAAIGALQLATAIAQPLPPIPAFAEGTDNAPGGLAIVGDGGGSEMIVTPDGKVSLSDSKPQLIDLPKGSQVFNHVITESILKKTRVNNDDASNDIQKVVIEEKTNIIAAELKGFHRRENEALLKGFRDVFSDKPIQELKVNRGELISVLRRGNMSIENWSDKNSD